MSDPKSIGGFRVVARIPQGPHFKTAAGTWWTLSPRGALVRADHRTSLVLRCWLSSIESGQPMGPVQIGRS